MITPRRTRLVRVPNLAAFRRTIGALCRDAADPMLVVVPSRGAARQLARGFGRDDSRSGPVLVTRDELYAELHGRLPSPPRRLSAFEREAMFDRAARQAAEGMAALPFRVRPGLVAEMVRFYDQLRRQSQQVKRFEELLEQALGGEAALDDRGGARLLLQTRFLARTFGAYESAVRASGACDEHTLRELLVTHASADPIRGVLVTLPDWIADPAGLFVADFDLLARVPHLATIDIVCTERVLASGFHERLHSWLPGLEEAAGAAQAESGSTAGPVLLVPAQANPALDSAAPTQLWFTERDREEELVRVARRARRLPHLDRIAVVFKRPLPYLYLAPDTLGAAGLAYQSVDALPLAAEPAAAALDLALDLVESGFSRDAVVALLRCPHLTFGEPLERASIAALDRELSDHRYLGDLQHLERFTPRQPAAEPPLRAALSAAAELRPLRERASASSHIRLLAGFLARHAAPIDPAAPSASRERRARAAILELLEGLAAAREAHFDPDWTIDEVAVAIRTWIETETFTPTPIAANAIHLLDDQAGRYGDFDELSMVGVVEDEWPEKPHRNIFYPGRLLKALGWPTEKDRRAAADARFLDLLWSASQRVSVSAFSLEDDVLTTRSSQLDEISASGLPTMPDDTDIISPILRDELLAREPLDLTALEPASREWAALRLERPDRSSASFHGRIDPPGDRVWSVSALETYLGCPFKFYARYVLRLDEEPEDEEVMDPRRQGQLVHGIFEDFFSRWTASGAGAITPASLDEARRLFREVVDDALAQLSPAEAALERARLLGSPAAAGLGEAVFRMEAERPVPVVERMLERSFSGRLAIRTTTGARSVAVRGKADRLDLLDDGTFRLIDYKLGWPPNRARALQLPIYGLCAEAELDGYRGRRWTLGEAAYLAFKGPKRVVPLFAEPADRHKVLADAQQRLADTLDGIGRGDFPPTPDDVYRCETCGFASVCRKDYVNDL